MTTAIWPTAPRTGQLTLRATAVLTCGLMSVGAAMIHFAVLGEHWREWWGYGLFFGAAAWLQVAWTAIVITRPSSRLLAAGAIGSFAIAALWLLTRIGGIPVGPAAGETESATFIDSVATAFEVALGLGAFLAAAKPAERLTLRRPLAAIVVFAVAAGVVILTTASLIDASSPSGGHNGDSSNGTSHDHHGAVQP